MNFFKIISRSGGESKRFREVIMNWADFFWVARVDSCWNSAFLGNLIRRNSSTVLKSNLGEFDFWVTEWLRSDSRLNKIAIYLRKNESCVEKFLIFQKIL